MSKITFRADDDLIQELEAFDASKSEVMRRALRQFLDEHATPREDTGVNGAETAVNVESEASAEDESLLAERVDAAVERRLGALDVGRARPQDVNVNITIDGASEPATEVDDERAPATDRPGGAYDPLATCAQCGETLNDDHVYCPNCGEKASRRVFCDCGDELRSDWSFCPDCGRRTPAADVLDSA